MASAGYNPQSAIDVWHKMSAVGDKGAVSEFMSTHPSDQSRITALQALMPQVLDIYQ